MEALRNAIYNTGLRMCVVSRALVENILAPVRHVKYVSPLWIKRFPFWTNKCLNKCFTSFRTSETLLFLMSTIVFRFCNLFRQCFLMRLTGGWLLTHVNTVMYSKLFIEWLAARDADVVFLANMSIAMTASHQYENGYLHQVVYIIPQIV